MWGCDREALRRNRFWGVEGRSLLRVLEVRSLVGDVGGAITVGMWGERSLLGNVEGRSLFRDVGGAIAFEVWEGRSLFGNVEGAIIFLEYW